MVKLGHFQICSRNDNENGKTYFLNNVYECHEKSYYPVCTINTTHFSQ